MTVVSRNYKVNLAFEERADAPNKGVFRGDSIRFNEWSVDLGGFKEIIIPSAWDSADVTECLAVFNHEEEFLLGSYEAGTLRFRVHEQGVETEIDKANTTISKDCAEWVSRGEIKGQSFKFVILEDDWTYDENADILLRTIKKLGKIYDTSLVTRPAYPTTTVEGRSKEVDILEIRSRLIPSVVIKEKKEEEVVEEQEMRSTSEILYNFYLNKHKARRL